MLLYYINILFQLSNPYSQYQYIINARYSENFTQLMRFQTERARTRYDAALAALPPEDRRAQRAGLIMCAIYRTVLDEVAADGYKVLTQRTSLTPMRKLWIAISTWLRT